MIAVRAMLCAGAMLLASGAAAAAEVGDLARAQVRVTGQGEANRALAFAQALAEVLVKLTGDPRLAGDPAVAALGARAGTLVAAFSYRDLMAGIPTHDEQGTRDRPYELTVTFDPARLDAALRALGRAPWGATGGATRPRVAVFVVVRGGAVPYALAADGGRGRDQREALIEAAARRGVPIALPGQAMAAGLDVASIAQGDRAPLVAAMRALGGDVLLAGSLAWSDAARGWIGAWRLDVPGASVRWQISGVTFDDAFRNAMGGAAQILSGNGQPAP